MNDALEKILQETAKTACVYTGETFVPCLWANKERFMPAPNNKSETAEWKQVITVLGLQLRNQPEHTLGSRTCTGLGVG